MKLSTFLIFVSMLQVFADGLGQGTTVTLKAYNTNLPSIFQEIEEQTDFRFVYKSEDVNSFTNVTLRAKENNINSILDQVLEDTGLKYRVLEDRLIVITPANFSQEITVKGKITDIEGNPLPGVNIVEKGTTNGAVTDLDGNYSINVSSANSVLIFSFIGYLSEEVEIAGQTSIDMTMVEDLVALEEVVVIGYGITRKSDLTGSVSSVEAEELANVAASRIVRFYKGKPQVYR